MGGDGSRATRRRGRREVLLLLFFFLLFLFFFFPFSSSIDHRRSISAIDFSLNRPPMAEIDRRQPKSTVDGRNQPPMAEFSAIAR
ncbi:hypothetical protein B296_00054805 [Ensete ventricosum]|uniref:Uncharacterized protein n=1 Tax=Ensete ventricosum TaxID=4639 RepID=A0A426X8T5_ENSVE|nr:hypothetical protein B296_00054805 [Ensete ventricosum]